MNDDKSELIHLLINTDSIKLQDMALKPSDIIQSALKYNTYLINQVIESKYKHTITQTEYDATLQRLWNNLSILTKSVDSYLEKYPLKSNSHNDEEDTSHISHSIRKSRRTQQQELIECKQFSNYDSGLIVEINKNILK